MRYLGLVTVVMIGFVLAWLLIGSEEQNSSEQPDTTQGYLDAIETAEDLATEIEARNR